MIEQRLSRKRLLAGAGVGVAGLAVPAARHTAKLFPTAKAADTNRAHLYCNCSIEQAATIP
jgi:hypothetical protein